jgi:C-terminal processing protease CtpA/Prc
MIRKIKLMILPLFFLLSACQLFLGPEPDTSPSEVLKSLWDDFNNIHANLDFRMSNNNRYNSWYDVYYNRQNGYALKIYSGISEESLFYVCSSMLKELNDPHVGLFAPGKFSSSYVDDYSEYFSISAARNLLSGRGNDEYTNFIYGTFISCPDIGYIYISSFINGEPEQYGQEWGRAVDNIIKNLANTSALVLDVRSNRGGEIYAMEYIAAYFTSEYKDYMKVRTKTGPGPNDLSEPRIYTTKSINKISDDKHGYIKPIVLITNRNTVSAAEWFTMALRTQKNVTHIGTPTCGAFSSRKDRFMINGWFYSISPERVTDINGVHYEGKGIFPKEENIISNTVYSKDEQLEYAIGLLK